MLRNVSTPLLFIALGLAASGCGAPEPLLVSGSVSLMVHDREGRSERGELRFYPRTPAWPHDRISFFWSGSCARAGDGLTIDLTNNNKYQPTNAIAHLVFAAREGRSHGATSVALDLAGGRRFQGGGCSGQAETVGGDGVHLVATCLAVPERSEAGAVDAVLDLTLEHCE